MVPTSDGRRGFLGREELGALNEFCLRARRIEHVVVDRTNVLRAGDAMAWTTRVGFRTPKRRIVRGEEIAGTRTTVDELVRGEDGGGTDVECSVKGASTGRVTGKLQ